MEQRTANEGEFGGKEMEGGILFSARKGARRLNETLRACGELSISPASSDPKEESSTSERLSSGHMDPSREVGGEETSTISAKLAVGEI